MGVGAQVIASAYTQVCKLSLCMLWSTWLHDFASDHWQTLEADLIWSRRMMPSARKVAREHSLRHYACVLKESWTSGTRCYLESRGYQAPRTLHGPDIGGMGSHLECSLHPLRTEPGAQSLAQTQRAGPSHTYVDLSKLHNPLGLGQPAQPCLLKPHAHDAQHPARHLETLAWKFAIPVAPAAGYTSNMVIVLYRKADQV